MGRSLRGIRYCCPDWNVMTISSPVCKSFSLTTLLGFLDFKISRALQSEVLPVAIGTRNAVYG